MPSKINQHRNNPSTVQEHITMANDITLDDILDMLADKVVERINGAAEDVEEAPAPRRRASKKAAPEPDEDEPEDDDTEAGEKTRAGRKAELEAINVRTLRKMLVDNGYGADDVADADKATCVATLLVEEGYGENDDDVEPEPDEDEGDDEGDEGEDEPEEGYTREELEEMSLAEVKGVAKESGYAAADYRGMSQDAIIDMLLDTDEGDEAGDDEDEPEDEESEGDEYTEEDFQNMNLRELKALAREWGIKVPAGMKQPELADMLASAE